MDDFCSVRTQASWNFRKHLARRYSIFVTKFSWKLVISDVHGIAISGTIIQAAIEAQSEMWNQFTQWYLHLFGMNLAQWIPGYSWCYEELLITHNCWLVLCHHFLFRLRPESLGEKDVDSHLDVENTLEPSVRESSATEWRHASVGHGYSLKTSPIVQDGSHHLSSSQQSNSQSCSQDVHLGADDSDHEIEDFDDELLWQN